MSLLKAHDPWWRSERGSTREPAKFCLSARFPLVCGTITNLVMTLHHWVCPSTGSVLPSLVNKTPNSLSWPRWSNPPTPDTENYGDRPGSETSTVTSSPKSGSCSNVANNVCQTFHACSAPILHELEYKMWNFPYEDKRVISLKFSSQMYSNVY